MRPLFFSTGMLACLSFSMSSCLFPAKLAKRYKSSETHAYAAKDDSIKYLVAVSGYAFSVKKKMVKPAEPAKTIFSLSGEGQKQLIEAVSDNEKTSDDIYNQLAQTIGPEKEQLKVRDYTKFSKRVVLSVSSKLQSPADRVLNLSVALGIKGDEHVKLVSCDKVATNRQSVDFTRNITEHAKIEPADVLLSSHTDAAGLVFYEDNVGGVDLTGNITADINLAVSGNKVEKTAYLFSGLQSKDKSSAKPNDIAVAQQRIIYPNLSKDISLSLSYEASVKHVAKGDNTISESDDELQLLKGSATGSDILIATKEQLTPKFWVISDNTYTLEIAGPAPQSTLLFDSYENALAFILWLKRSSSEILVNNKISNGDYQLLISGTLTDTFIKNCVVKMQ